MVSGYYCDYVYGSGYERVYTHADDVLRKHDYEFEYEHCV